MSIIWTSCVQYLWLLWRSDLCTGLVLKSCNSDVCAIWHPHLSWVIIKILYLFKLFISCLKWSMLMQGSMNDYLNTTIFEDKNTLFMFLFALFRIMLFRSWCIFLQNICCKFFSQIWAPTITIPLLKNI